MGIRINLPEKVIFSCGLFDPVKFSDFDKSKKSCQSGDRVFSSYIMTTLIAVFLQIFIVLMRPISTMSFHLNLIFF